MAESQLWVRFLPGSDVSIWSLCTRRQCRILGPPGPYLVAPCLKAVGKVRGEMGEEHLLAAWLRHWTILSNLGSVFVFSLLFRRTFRDHDDFWKHHPPSELSVCCAALLGYFHQRYKSKAAKFLIVHCHLQPQLTFPLLIRGFPSVPFLFFSLFLNNSRSHRKGDSWCLCLRVRYRWHHQDIPESRADTPAHFPSSQAPHQRTSPPKTCSLTHDKNQVELHKLQSLRHGSILFWAS